MCNWTGWKCHTRNFELELLLHNCFFLSLLLYFVCVWERDWLIDWIIRSLTKLYYSFVNLFSQHPKNFSSFLCPLIWTDECDSMRIPYFPKLVFGCITVEIESLPRVFCTRGKENIFGILSRSSCGKTSFRSFLLSVEVSFWDYRVKAAWNVTQKWAKQGC